MTIEQLQTLFDDLPETDIMPALFIGHGSPMNGIDDAAYAKKWSNIGKELPRPRAILSISAHWYIPETSVHISTTPRTIHDFYGFPPELYDMQYPAPGSPDVAQVVREIVGSDEVTEDTAWGLDHGTWIVLRHMFPLHDVPVFQLSINSSKEASYHYHLGETLRALRKRGVLIMGSGNIVHNLSRLNFSGDGSVFPWAERFDAYARDAIIAGDHASLINYHTLGEDAQISIPTPDHYLPLLYVLGTQEKDDVVTFPTEGMDLGSVSMRSVMLQPQSH